MTFRDVLSAMLRRWYIPLALLVCTAVVTMMLVRDGGVYTTKTVVSFMRAATTSLSPANGTNDSSVIAFAGAVVQEANNGQPPARYSMDDAPYYGAGVREGVLIELANSGNQWVSTFSKSDVEIEIVGRSFDWVASRQHTLVDTILRIAETQQASLTMSSDDRITATVVPLTMQIEHVAPSRSSQIAAIAAMLAAALISGAWVSITVDRLFSRRRATAGARTKHSSQRMLEGTTS